MVFLVVLDDFWEEDFTRDLKDFWVSASSFLMSSTFVI